MIIYLFNNNNSYTFICNQDIVNRCENIHTFKIKMYKNVLLLYKLSSNKYHIIHGCLLKTKHAFSFFLLLIMNPFWINFNINIKYM